MSRRASYHVSPAGKRGWQVKATGATSPLSYPRTQAGAERIARQTAKAHDLGQVVIHRRDGRIREEHTYRQDPYPPKG